MKAASAKEACEKSSQSFKKKVNPAAGALNAGDAAGDAAGEILKLGRHLLR